MKAKASQRRADLERGRVLNHEAAVLNSFAHHAPGKMPKYRPPRDERRPVDQAAALANARGYFRTMAARGKKKAAGG